jgi:hypothetical protein
MNLCKLMVHSRKILTGLSLWCNEIVVSSGVKYSINFFITGGIYEQAR